MKAVLNSVRLVRRQSARTISASVSIVMRIVPLAKMVAQAIACPVQMAISNLGTEVSACQTALTVLHGTSNLPSVSAVARAAKSAISRTNQSASCAPTTLLCTSSSASLSVPKASGSRAMVRYAKHEPTLSTRTSYRFLSFSC